jgi:hypothetical protein
VRGGERPQSVPLNLGVRLSTGCNLLDSDDQDSVSDRVDYDGILYLTSTDTSQRCALVSDIDGCFGSVKGGDDHSRWWVSCLGRPRSTLRFRHGSLGSPAAPGTLPWDAAGRSGDVSNQGFSNRCCHAPFPPWCSAHMLTDSLVTLVVSGCLAQTPRLRVGNDQAHVEPR